MMIILLVCLTLASAQSCASLSDDPNPGLTPAIPPAELAAAVPPASPCIESRIVRSYVQAAALPAPAGRTNCPHMDVALQPFQLSGRAVGSNVDITGRRIIRPCDVDATLLGRITVKSGAELVFADADMNLHVGEILVEAGATLTAGSASCPMLGKLDIMFHGTRADSSLQNDDRTRTSKGLVVEGTLNVYGKKYAPTWTRLAKTAAVGDRIIFLQQPTNWEAGQRVLLTTSAHQDCPPQFQAAWCNNRPHQNEVIVIDSITMDRAQQVYAIKLVSALQYRHHGGAEYQSEVALMDRRIRFWGAPEATGFGMHVIIMGSGICHFSGAHVENGGQAHVMARYPIHLHVLRESPNSFIEDSLFSPSNFRAIVIHGTNSSRVSRNVGYDIQGMALYLEDGVEEKNLIEYNLMAYVAPIKQPADGGYGQGGETFSAAADLMLPADTSASPFYISNAYNDFVGNQASGGWAGFAFPNIPVIILLLSLYSFIPWRYLSYLVNI